MPHGFALALAFAIALVDEPFAFQVLKHSFEVGLLLGGRCRFAVVVGPVGVGGRDEVRDAITVSELLARGMAMIRSDAYTLFLGAAGLIIVVLLTALWLLPSS